MEKIIFVVYVPPFISLRAVVGTRLSISIPRQYFDFVSGRGRRSSFKGMSGIGDKACSGDSC